MPGDVLSIEGLGLTRPTRFMALCDCATRKEPTIPKLELHARPYDFVVQIRCYDYAFNKYGISSLECARFLYPHSDCIQAIDSFHLEWHAYMKTLAEHEPMTALRPMLPEVKLKLRSELRFGEHALVRPNV